MMALEKATVILIVLVWTGDSLANHHRSRRSNNEYILHRCTVTAELIRKHRHEEAVGVSSRKAEEDPSQTLHRDTGAVSGLIDVLQSGTSKETPSSVYRRTTHMRRRAGNGRPRRIASRQMADTPLKTVNINVPKDRPSAFRKKNPLPELGHDISESRKLDSPPHVIVIKPVT